MVDITFPVLLYYNGKLHVHNADSFKAVGAKFISESTFLHMEFKEKEKEGWLVEYSGTFHTLTPIGKKYDFLRPAKFIWNFVKSVFEVETKKTISVKQFKDIVVNSRENSLAKDLIRFLSELSRDEVVNKELLNKWLI